MVFGAVPKGCRGKLWQVRGGLFVGVEHALHGVGGEGMSVVGVERKSGASLFEKGKWETAYQFQEVIVNATKFGQDCIKKPVQPTGKWYHSPIFVHSEKCQCQLPPNILLLQESIHAKGDMHAVFRLRK